jgi:hypothetical protein
MTAFQELLDEAADIDGVRHVMVVDPVGGEIVAARSLAAASGGPAGLPSTDEVQADLRRQLDIVASTEGHGLVQDVVLSSGPDHILLRTVSAEGRTVVLRVTLDRALANLAAARFALRSATRRFAPTGSCQRTTEP